MTKINEKAVDFVLRLINTLDSKASVYFDRNGVNQYIYRFQLTSQEQDVKIQFTRAPMDDFEVAIQKYRDTDYYYTLENSIKFKIYIELGSRGLLTDFEVSSELLNEKGQWAERCWVNVSFDKKMCESLNSGLRRLSSFLEQILGDHNLDLSDVKADKKSIDGLIQYYEKHGHLNSEGVGVQSLGFLKAAAVCEIIEKEKQKSQTKIPRVKSEIDKEIYRIVHILRQAPFLGIKLPECIHDYSDANKDIDIQSVREVSQVRIAQEVDDRLNALLDKLNPNLKKKRIGAWIAFSSDNPDRLSQSANSMVELLDKVIGQLCANIKLSEYLEKKYGTSEETQWIDATQRWISQTKNKLQRVKHHPDYQAEILARTLLSSAETIMLALLE